MENPSLVCRFGHGQACPEPLVGSFERRLCAQGTTLEAATRADLEAFMGDCSAIVPEHRTRSAA
jgi:hypothetical protein